MARIPLLEPSQAPGKSKDLLKAVQESLKVTPNLAKGLANSPAALQAWVDLNGALGKGSLDARTREEIALLVAQENGCEYCLSAHTAIGKHVGLSEGELRNSRKAQGHTPKATAALEFARELLSRRGQVTPGSIEALRQNGLTDGEIAEVVAHVALNVFTNYFNIALEVDVDFPRVALSQAA